MGGGEDDLNGRYHRQTLISWWEQDRLAAAKVLVVGAGALGNELVKDLALVGVGTVVVADMDTIENSNLSRCVFFRASDEGRFKAEVVCEAAAGLNPDVQFVPIVGDIRSAIGLSTIGEFDLVLGGLDNREARLHINRACWKAGVPWIDGAIEGLMGVVKVFVPPASACYECTMSERDHELLASRRTCALLTREEMLEGKVPTTGTSASVVAGLQVQEAIKLLHADRLPESMAGKGFVINGMTHDSYLVDYPRHEDCLSHDTYALTDAAAVPRERPVADLIAFGAELLGAAPGDVSLELEHDVIVGFDCPACDGPRSRDGAPVLLSQATAGSALCPDCHAERNIDLRHAFSLSSDGDALELSADTLALPPRDVLTVRSAHGRVHLRLDDPLPWEFVDAEIVEEAAR